MKTKLIKSGKVEILLIKMDQSATFSDIEMIESMYPYYRFLSTIEDLTEEQAEELVIGWNTPSGFDDYQETYQNYLIKCDKDFKEMYHFYTAIESFHSLLDSNEVLFENPYGKTYEEAKIKGWTLKHEWEEAQQSVFNPKTTLIFVKND